jgi:hypothetical protein
METGLSNILVRTGGNLLESLPATLAGLLPRLKEKLAASELLKRFRKPESLLAVPVFMELSRMDVEAYMELQKSQGEIKSAVDRLKEQVAGALQLFIAEQVNLVEGQLKQHEVAFESSAKISSETAGGLHKQLGEFEPKFADKKQKLNETRRALYGLWGKVKDSFEMLTQQSESPVMNKVELSTGPALMAA